MVVCPDKFRGSLTASEAAAILAAPFRQAGSTVSELPITDGGEGFLEIVMSHLEGTGVPTAPPSEWRTTVVDGPAGDLVEVPWAVTHDGVAVVESALACGHPVVGASSIDPVAASTRGVGQILVAAREAGARRVLLGVGGTVTTDGGLGALEALGWSAPGMEVVLAVDTRTAFLDAARVFAPQKGASPREVALLSERLRRTASVIHERTGVDVTAIDGSGAGGGLAGGLVAAGASLRPGIEVVASASGLGEHLAGADLVVTGEGRLDRSSLDGKVVGWVLDRARPGRRALVVGAADPTTRAALPDDVRVRVLRDDARDDHDSMSRAAELLERAAASFLDGAAPRPPAPTTGRR